MDFNLIDLQAFQKLHPLGAGRLKIRIAMKYENKIKFAPVFFKKKITSLPFNLRNKEKM